MNTKTSNTIVKVAFYVPIFFIIGIFIWFVAIEPTIILGSYIGDYYDSANELCNQRGFSKVTDIKNILNNSTYVECDDIAIYAMKALYGENKWGELKPTGNYYFEAFNDYAKFYDASKGITN